MMSFDIGFEKEGHPHPELNLSWEVNNGSPLTTSTYNPFSLKSLYFPLNGISVALFCVTSYSVGSNFLIFSFIFNFSKDSSISGSLLKSTWQ